MGSQIKFILNLVLLLSLCSVVYAESYKMGTEIAYYPSNSLADDSNSKLSSIIPAVILVVAIVFTLIDFGAIGVCVAAIISIFTLSIFGIIGLTIMSVIAYVALAILILFRVFR